MIDKLEINMVNVCHVPTNDLKMEANDIIEADIKVDVYKSKNTDLIMLGFVLDALKEDMPSFTSSDLHVASLSVKDIYDKLGELYIRIDIKREKYTYRRVISLLEIFGDQNLEEVSYEPIKLFDIKVKIDGVQLTMIIKDKDDESYTYKFMLD